MLGKTPKQIGQLEDAGLLDLKDKMFLYAWMGWRDLEDYKMHGFEVKEE